MKFSLEEILIATNAKVLKNETLASELFTFSTDTRTIKEGEIYLPLKGENFDGEKFVDKAIEVGAVGYFTTKIQRNEDVMRRNGLKFLDTRLILQVEDTLKSYLQLALFYKRKINPKTIAITGSSGKTTTKEMAFCVACKKFRTHKSELNFNNEIGLCQTILTMPENTQVLVLEMGMRGLGEIELLSKYSEPDIPIITNVGTAHIGRLISKENIVKAKCEIVSYMNKNGVLIAHNDELIKDALCNTLLQSYIASENERCICYPSSTVIQKYFSLNDTEILVRQVGYCKFLYKGHKYELNIEGDYNIQNALAAIEMGLTLGMDEIDINFGLSKYCPIEKRGAVQNIGGFKFVNDSYNANPESMKAILENVLDIYPLPLLIILGDMGELGKNEVQYHKELGEFLCKRIKSDVDVFTVGKLANEITKVLVKHKIPSRNFDNNLQISRYILDNMEFGTTIVLKASRSMQFENILNEIKNKK